MNYSYEKERCKKFGKTGVLCGSKCERAAVKYSAWVIRDPEGKKVAEAEREFDANIIVMALNGNLS